MGEREKALRDLVALHDKFMAAQGGFMGNQADAFNIIASRFAVWDAARAALTPTEGSGS